MATALTTDALLAALKASLHDLTPADFERVTAALISEHTGLGIAVAKSGFQHGADAGPAGRRGRRFRIETKRYADNTRLSDRELVGEVDDALGLDAALEAWFLVATRAAPEQLEQKLLRKSDETGVPIVIIDWKPDGFPALAALCTVSPQVLDSMVSSQVGDLARALTTAAAEALIKLTRDMEAWNLGFARLREVSHGRLQAIWESPRASQSELGQDAAGGAHPHIRREAVHHALDEWWSGRATSDAPAVVMGFQGSGKTWATLHWLMERLDDQPLIILVPSKFAAGLTGVSRSSIKRFIAERLYELADSRDPEHWGKRLDRLLKRPSGEGPAITIVFDGMNEHVLAPWKDVIAVFQAPEFSGRVRVVAITRNLHFTERLGRLASLIEQPETVEVGPFDDAAGGELDQRLALEGLTRSDLHEDLIPIAQTPRLFSLVVRLRDRLIDGGTVTVHRLLWEYGRDTLTPGTNAFGEQEWLSWLAEVARNRLEGRQEYDLASIGSMVERPDLDEGEIFRRLSEIVDSELANRQGSHGYQLSQTLVAHALGAALLDHLQRGNFDDRDAVEQALDNWLDPIAGLDEKAEILRAAISILLVDTSETGDILSPLVSAWLNSQNLPESHRSEVLRLAQPLCDPLLDIVETSFGTAEALAIEALQAMPADTSLRERVIGRCVKWLSTISRNVDPREHRNADQERSRSQAMINRIGVDVDGPQIILGRELIFVERSRLEYGQSVARLLEGRPLADAIDVFEIMALRVSISRRYEDWESFKWLCLLNEVDFAETAAALLARSDALLNATPEPGVAVWLAARAAALLLWLSGDEDLEALAVERDPGEDRGYDYDTDYLADPAESMYALERRHADLALLHDRLSVRRRIDRTKAFWTDFRFESPPAFDRELEQAMQAFDVSTLDSGVFEGPADHSFGEISIALARTAPELLASLYRAKLTGLPQRQGDAQAMAALRSFRQLLLADEPVRQAAQETRCIPPDTGAGPGNHARSQLLLLEILDLPPSERIGRILDARLNGVYSDYEDLLLPLNQGEVDGLITRYRDADPEVASQLTQLLVMARASIGAESWGWIEARLVENDEDQRGVAMRLLFQSDPQRLGLALVETNWRWSGGAGLWIDHFGSLAIITATVGLPFDRVAPAIAPWLLPRAVALRGGSVDDVEIATAILRHVVEAQAPEPVDPGSELTVSDERRADDPAAVTMTITYGPGDGSIEDFEAALDVDRRTQIRGRAIETARARIQEARANGASLHLRDFRAGDMFAFIEHASSAVDAWLAGMEEGTPDFRRRVRRSEGFYVALCEALLERDPERGAALWFALKGALVTTFVGAAEVDMMTHMAFRVATCPEEVRQRILTNATTDQTLLELTLAAALHDRTDWLSAVVADDISSGVTWKLQRSRKLAAFDPEPPSEIPEWPAGEAVSLRLSRERKVDSWRRRGAFARHWWDTYWAAPSDELAYAAWVLLLKSVDRRGVVWMRLPDDAQRRSPRRLAHFKANRDELKKAMKVHEKDFEREFLGRRITSAVGPWRSS